MTRLTDPRSAALAYRIWAYAHPRGWDVTARDIADGLEEPVSRVRAIVGNRPIWANRLRSSTPDCANARGAFIAGLTNFDNNDSFGGVV